MLLIFSFFFFLYITVILGCVKGSLDFPGGSYGEESACYAGDLGSMPELGRSPRKGNRSIL